LTPLALPRLGMGTWHMGESPSRRAAEVAALRAGLDLGFTLIDTAQMYAAGGAEEVVGEAIRGRSDVFVVSKFYPHHAARRALLAACDGSLARLGVEAIDLYLLHWRGAVPLAETVATLEELARAGKIRRWGVSNFDVADMEELVRVPGGAAVAANQVLYHLGSRGIEFDLLPWCAQRAVAVMAYSPLDEGRLVRNAELSRLAGRLGVTAAGLALAWAVRTEGVCAIPKAALLEHLRDDRAALDIVLDEATLAQLDRAFPPPRRKARLGMI